MAFVNSPATANTIDSSLTPMSEERSPCTAFTDDATYVDFSIRMQLEDRHVPMRVPKQYFEDFWDRKSGYETTSQLFSVEIGSFAPVSRPETSKRNRVGVHNWFTFNTTDVVPLDEVAAIHMKLSILIKDRKRISGVFTRLPGPHGLYELGFSGVQPQFRRPENVYIAESPSKGLTSVLECDAPDSVLNPGCQLNFRASGMDVTLNFQRSDLPNWREFQADTTQFLNCATSSGA
ncbi:hypothetical protein [Falsihalocynthiibacter arcticus]|uniref:hypothetical protein n=1 Tax=Falsihalocynthiibacter arcticus TaxID=1579316 RepID=UPI0012E8AE3F|nr:hypothetical protein [Falsihalocynthiibacter arcticus]